MDFHLIVKDDFAGYKKGDRIEDADEVAGILESESHERVVRVAAPAAAPSPAPSSDRFASE